MKVKYVDLGAQWAEDRQELLPIIDEVLAAGHYILGAPVEELEELLAQVCHTNHCVALNSGTDALTIALAALGVEPGDEVITQPNSFVASAAAIVHLGARPVFVDVLPDQTIDPDRVQAVLTKRTRAIVPVHLTGRMCEMESLRVISEASGVPLVEDAAQAIGSALRGRPSGSWGEIGCFSAHPLKNLAAAGDAGFIVTNSAEVAAKARGWRNHGMVNRNTVVSFGGVSRMDTVQAAILKFRLAKLSSITAQRQLNAQKYFSLLKNSCVTLPKRDVYHFDTFHTFVVQVDRRDDLRKFLEERGVETAIHYPTPIHLQPASAGLGYVRGDFPICEGQAQRILSLPIHQHLSQAEIEFVASSILEFYR